MPSPNSQVAASSSPIYGGGLRWGTNDLAYGGGLRKGTNDFLCALPPILAFPRFDGGRRRCRMPSPNSHVAASSPPIYGGGLRWGTNNLALTHQNPRAGSGILLTSLSSNTVLTHAAQKEETLCAMELNAAVNYDETQPMPNVYSGVICAINSVSASVLGDHILSPLTLWTSPALNNIW